MKLLLRCALFALILTFPSIANAAARFLVACVVSCTIDASSTINWSSTSGGAPGSSVPVAGDTVTFDGSSGGGAVTTNANFTWSSFTWGAFTGTVDLATNNNALTISGTVANAFSGSGSATRTFNCGTGNIIVSGAVTTPWTMTTTTGLTWNCGSSNITISGNPTSQATFAGGGLAYNSITLTGGSNRAGINFTGVNTVLGTFTFTAPMTVLFPGGSTTTIGTTVVAGGSSSNLVTFLSSTTGVATISSASSPTPSWFAAKGITYTGGGSVAATNAFDLGNNTGFTFTPPASSSGGRIIGG